MTHKQWFNNVLHLHPVHEEGATVSDFLLFNAIVKIMGSFHSTQTFENLEIVANGTEIFWKSFQKFWKLLNLRNANHSNKNFRNSGSKVEWKENSREIFFENLGIPREVVLFFGNVRKSSLLVQSTEKCCSIHYWMLPEIQTGSFG